MENIAPLQVFFSHRPKNCISRMISFFQNGISHVGFRFELVACWVWEAKGHGGLSFSDPVDFDQNSEVLEAYDILWTEDERHKALELMSSMLRSSYGFLGVLGMIPVLIVRKLGGWTNNPFPFGYFCSQAVYKVLKEIFSFYVDGNPQENRIGPEDLQILLRELSVSNPDKVKLKIKKV